MNALRRIWDCLRPSASRSYARVGRFPEHEKSFGADAVLNSISYYLEHRWPLPATPLISNLNINFLGSISNSRIMWEIRASRRRLQSDTVLFQKHRFP